MHYFKGHQREEKFGDMQRVATYEQNSGKSGKWQQPKSAHDWQYCFTCVSGVFHAVQSLLSF